VFVYATRSPLRTQKISPYYNSGPYRDCLPISSTRAPATLIERRMELLSRQYSPDLPGGTTIPASWPIPRTGSTAPPSTLVFLGSRKLGTPIVSRDLVCP